jgi:hypothetical protein
VQRAAERRQDESPVITSRTDEIPQGQRSTPHEFETTASAEATPDPAGSVGSLAPATGSEMQRMSSGEREDYHDALEEIDRLRALLSALRAKAEHMELMLRAIDAATDLSTARRRANKGLNFQNACDDARPLGAVASGALFEEPAGKTPVNSNLQKSAE